MPKASPIQNSFNAGEFSPLVYGCTDYKKYGSGLKTCLNYIPLIQGPATRRPGTYFVEEAKDSTKATRVVRFEFSTTQAYIIEFGDLYCRFYKDQGRIESPPSTPVEIVTPYAEADLFQLKFTQSADTLYITHPSYEPRKLTRSSHTSWTLTTIVFLDGPYIGLNTTATTLTPSATTGTGITITASAVTGINSDAGFTANDIGRYIRVKHISGTTVTWGYAKITAVGSTTSVTADVKSAFGATTATADWRLGEWSIGTGYPACTTFYEDRLFFAGCTSYPQRLDGSKSGDYENMAPSDTAGVVAADNALAYTLNSDNVNVVQWLAGDEKALLAGTAGGVWSVRPSTLSEALSPTNVSAKRSVNRGSANIQAVAAGDAVLYVQRSGRKVYEATYSLSKDGYVTSDMSILSPHITRGGIKEIALQQEPQMILWAVRNDGALLGMTYEREQEVTGWHRHTIGGAYSTGDAVVESVAVIPEPNGTYEQAWLVVKRTINGSTKRYIEYMTKTFMEDDDAIEDAFFVDCGLTYSGVAVTSVSGLDHLEGQTVQVLADGAAHPDCVVTGGTITLSRSATKVHAGLSNHADGQILRMDAGAADGTAQGKIKRPYRLVMRFYNSVGLKIGRDFDSLDAIPFRTGGSTTGSAVSLFSGDKATEFEADYDRDGYICWRQDQPLPSTIVAIMPQLYTQDG